jgi:hypothetical protein
MPAYDKGMLPQDVRALLVFLREELQRIEAYAHTPRTEGAWDDLRFPAQAIGAGASGVTWDSTYGGMKYPSNADSSIQAVAQMPHSWKEGSNIRPHIHWQPAAGTALGSVATVWRLCVVWRNNGETQGAATCATVTVTPSASSTLALQITEFPELTATGKNISSILDITLTRLASTSAADNMLTDAILKEFDIHYLTDSFGSDLEYVKR